MSDPMRPRASLRTAVVWEVLKEALDRRVQATGRAALDVLDTGGGSGNFAVPLAALGHRVTVVDPSPNALFALERRAAEAGVAERVQGVQGDVLGLFDVVERGGYDAVLCHGVLEYVEDPAEGVRNAVDALRPEGALSLLAAGLGGAVISRALAGHFTEAQHALSDPAGRWGAGDPVAQPVHRRASHRARRRGRGERGGRPRRTGLRRPGPGRPRGHRAGRPRRAPQAGGGRRRTPRLPRHRHPAARPRREARLTSAPRPVPRPGSARMASGGLISDAVPHGVRHRPPDRRLRPV